MSFFQLKALITVENRDTATTLIDRFFNMEIIVQNSKKLEKLCPFHGFDAISREVLIGFTTPVVMMLILLVLQLIVRFAKSFRPSNKMIEWFLCRFYLGYYIILAFCYKNICRSAFTLINCKTMDKVTFLYIDGNVECFTFWQVADFVFLIFWILPFPLAVSLGYSLLKRKSISMRTYGTP